MTDRSDSQRVLFVSCAAHAVQDGLVALQYVLLPILSQAFGLSYAQVGLLRGISATAMSILEIPSGIMAERWSERPLLVFGLLCAGCGYLGVAHVTGFTLVALCFFIAGVGAGFQHSLASSLLVQTFEGTGRRRALGTYNSSGDAGKLMFTAAFSTAVGAGLAWNVIVTLLASAAVTLGLAAWPLLNTENIRSKNLRSKNLDRRRSQQSCTHANTDGETGTDGVHNPREQTTATRRSRNWGIKEPKKFGLLNTIVCLDSVVQAVFLTFLIFVLLGKGVDEAIAAGSLVLLLAGGMVGKFCCGFLAAKLGDRNTFIFVQLATVAGIGSVIVLPAGLLFLTLPLIGVFIQGSSTVTYGAVADFVTAGHQSRGYALIYTLSGIATIGGPFLFGLLADQWGLNSLLWALMAVTLVTIPLSFILGQRQI